MCEKVFRLVVAGGRDFTNYLEAEKILLSVLRNKDLKNVQVVSGGAKGADRIGEIFANKYGCGLRIFPANWNKYGKRAGHIRNNEMAENSDATILFWDGASRGTENMFFTTLGLNHKLFVAYYNPQTLEIIRCVDESNPF